MTTLPKLPPRKPDAHKGDFGRALVVGGSRGLAGAISLSGMACLRSGAGLVTLAVPESVLNTVAGYEPSYMTLPLAEDAEQPGHLDSLALAPLLKLAEKFTCVALGPGIGRSAKLDALVTGLYTSLALPMIVDADGLNALALRKDGLKNAGGPRILTPHPGEFRRLVGNEDLPRDAWEPRAIELAKENGVVIVLKGHHTLITDGERRVHNSTGNPGMATGGSGDVLTGIITALVCQGLAPFEAAQLGVHVHGLAGDLAARKRGEVGLIARDLVTFLPAAFLELTRDSLEPF